MKKALFFLCLFIFCFPNAIFFAQVGINTTTPDAGAVLDVVSTNKGLLLPRISSHTVISNPVNGLIIFDESDQCINFYANDSWINPCQASSASKCGAGYTAVKMKDVEVSAEDVGIAVSKDGYLFVTGIMTSTTVFGGLTLNQKLYDWVNYHDESLSVTPPFAEGTVLCADITHHSINRNSRVIVGTSTGNVYTIQNPNATWTTTTYAGATPVDVQAGNGYTVLDASGNVWYSTNGTTFTQVSIPEAIIGIKADSSETINSTFATLKHYAWSQSSKKLYVWQDNPAAVTTFTLASNVIDLDEDYNSGAVILLDNGAIYVYDGNVIGVTGPATPTSTPIVYTTNNSRVLGSSEKFVKIETSYSDATAVTNEGNFYTYSSSAGGWYFEYEIGSTDPNSVDISGAKNEGFTVISDGKMYSWGGITQGTSSAHTGLGGTFGNDGNGLTNTTISGNTPISFNICRQN